MVLILQICFAFTDVNADGHRLLFYEMETFHDRQFHNSKPCGTMNKYVKLSSKYKLELRIFYKQTTNYVTEYVSHL